MTVPFYVAPEQLMKDKADFARKGVARGRSLVALTYDDGVLLTAENPSAVQHKISEIYDRIAFAGVGKYSEFESLRREGVRFADLRGYQYSREDVGGRSLANAYAQLITQVFTHEIKPLEVEIIVAEVGHAPGEDQLIHILFDGTPMDENHFSVMGGEADPIVDRMAATYRDGMSLAEALSVATKALAGSDRELAADQLEVAVLARSRGRRAFARITGDSLAELLAAAPAG